MEFSVDMEVVVELNIKVIKDNQYIDLFCSFCLQLLLGK